MLLLSDNAVCLGVTHRPRFPKPDCAPQQNAPHLTTVMVRTFRDAVNHPIAATGLPVGVGDGGLSLGKATPDTLLPSSNSSSHAPPPWSPSSPLMTSRIFAALVLDRTPLNWNPALLSPLRAPPGAAGVVHPGPQPRELPAQVMPAQGDQELVLAKPPGQVHQDRGQAGSPRPPTDVSTRRSGCASGGVSTSAGPHWWSPCSTWVASRPGVIGGDGRSREGDSCLAELERSANVVKATSAAHRTPVHDDARWFCELDWPVDGIRESNYHGPCRGWCIAWVQAA